MASMLVSFLPFVFCDCAALWYLQLRAFKKLGTTGHWCLMPVILASQEAEIRRVTIQSQANSLRDPI
jgi:hypothetical protein